MRALVIGGSGFIGSHLVDGLLARSMEVRVCDRAPERFRDTPADVDFRQCDLNDTANLAEALQDVDIVFHLASTTVPSTSNLDPIADISGNLIATVRLLELMRESQVKRMVYLSSGGTVYGAPETDPVAESHPTHPISSYGIVKLAIEKYLLMEQNLHGLQPVILRASNPYGPRQGHGGVQGVIATFLHRVARGEDFNIWGDGSVVRDFLHISDLVSLCVECTQSEVVGTFNVGSGEGASIRDIIAVIEQVTGRTANASYEPGRSFDVPRIVLDTALVRAATNWAPKTSLADGVAETWEWVQRQTQ
ncbi:MAG: NAD-dependent epimerase/dehydratase family protein [Erythrobacter sp.]